MSGVPRFNFPAFDEAASHLRGEGWNIVSPAELDEPEIREEALQSPDGNPAAAKHQRSWGEFLARDVQIIADRCDAIILLPGWAHSRGAVLEATVALLCKHAFFLYDRMTGATRVGPTLIKHQLMGSPKL